MTPILVALPGNERLARGIAVAGGFETGELETRRFPDGEAYVRHRADLAGRAVALVCSLADPDSKLMTLLLAAGAARDLGATQVGLIAPYLAYMRQDTRFHEGEAVSAKVFARLISDAFDWLVTVDPHLHRIGRLDDVYCIPAEALHAGPLIADWIRREVQRPLLIGPDAESEQWVAAAARIAAAPYVVASKVRSGDRGVEIRMPDLSEWPDHKPVLVDDVASSGQTLLTAAEIILASHRNAPGCVVVHGLFAGDSYSRLGVLCDPIASTNTVPHESNRIDVSELICSALVRLADSASSNR